MLGNLAGVTQGGQTRSFAYDSLSRLREAYNPSQVNTSGQQVATVCQYDLASNLSSKSNPNGTSLSYGYDGMNRVSQKELEQRGVWVYSYDSGVNRKGRLVSVVKQGSTDGYYYDSYDIVGRVTSSRQITDGNIYAMSYGYDLAGRYTHRARR